MPQAPPDVIKDAWAPPDVIKDTLVPQAPPDVVEDTVVAYQAPPDVVEDTVVAYQAPKLEDEDEDEDKESEYPDASDISPIWKEFINYVFQSLDDKQKHSIAYVFGNGEMTIEDFREFNFELMIDHMHEYGTRINDKRWFELRFTGPLMAYWAMTLMCDHYDYLANENYREFTDIEDPFYRLVYFAYLCYDEDEDNFTTDYTRFYTLDNAFFSSDWSCFNPEFENVRIIAISWIRAKIAARRIQRCWRAHRATKH